MDIISFCKCLRNLAISRVKGLEDYTTTPSFEAKDPHGKKIILDTLQLNKNICKVTENIRS